MKTTLFATVVALAAVVDAGIYPDDHFDVSKKLTVDNFDATVQVRWTEQSRDDPTP